MQLDCPQKDTDIVMTTKFAIARLLWQCKPATV